LTSLLAFFSTEWKISIGMSVCTLYVIVILLAKPYYRKGDDRLHTMAQSQILLILLGGYILYVEVAYDYVTDYAMSTILIGLTCWFLLLFVVQSTRIFRKIYLDIRARAKVALAARRKREAELAKQRGEASEEATDANSDNNAETGSGEAPKKRKKGRSDYSIADYQDLLSSQSGGNGEEEENERSPKSPVPRGNVRGSVRVGTVQDILNEQAAPKLNIMSVIGEDNSAPPSPRNMVAAPETPKSPEKPGQAVEPLISFSQAQSSNEVANNSSSNVAASLPPAPLTPADVAGFNFTGTLTGPLPPIPTLSKGLNSNSLRDLLAVGDIDHPSEAPAPPSENKNV
jgi:hypothetical protein